MRTRALSLVALGVAAVGLDLRVVAVDLLPDVAGWLLVAWGAWRLSMGRAACLAAVAALASVSELELPYHYDALDPITGEVVPNPAPGLSYHERLAFDPLEGARLALVVLAVVLGTLALVLLLRELARRATMTGDPEAPPRLRLLAVAVAVGWALPYVVRAGVQVLDDGFDPVWNGAWELVALVGIGVMLAVAVTCALWSNRLWGSSGDEMESPWAELMVRDLDR